MPANNKLPLENRLFCLTPSRATTFGKNTSTSPSAIISMSTAALSIISSSTELSALF
jgi:hypothetical protein